MIRKQGSRNQNFGFPFQKHISKLFHFGNWTFFRNAFQKPEHNLETGKITENIPEPRTHSWNQNTFQKPENVPETRNPETWKQSGNWKNFHITFRKPENILEHALETWNRNTFWKLEKFPHYIPETGKYSGTRSGNLKISITPPRTRNMSEKQEHVPETRKISVSLSSKLEKNVLIILDTVHDWLWILVAIRV